MHSPSNGIRVLGFVCLLLAISVPAISQTTTGRILGTISDQSGAAVPGAAVVVTDIQRGTTRAGGHRRLRELRCSAATAGNLQDSRGSQGFQNRGAPQHRGGSRAGRTCGRHAPAGQVSETMVVTDEVPLVNTHILHVGRHAEQRGDQ